MMQDDEYKTIAGESFGLYREKKSKFIAMAFPVGSKEEIKNKLIALRKEYHDARHHCYAYQLGHETPLSRVNDDGEPSGTTGRPIHGQILSKELTNILVVVVRYFGGTKLGVSGLINAYKTAARDALDKAKIVKRTINDYFEITFDYPQMNYIKRIIKENNIEQIDQKFEAVCKFTISVRRKISNDIIQRLDKINSVIIKPVEICK